MRNFNEVFTDPVLRQIFNWVYLHFFEMTEPRLLDVALKDPRVKVRMASPNERVAELHVEMQKKSTEYLWHDVVRRYCARHDCLLGPGDDRHWADKTAEAFRLLRTTHMHIFANLPIVGMPPDMHQSNILRFTLMRTLLCHMFFPDMLIDQKVTQRIALERWLYRLQKFADKTGKDPQEFILEEGSWERFEAHIYQVPEAYIDFYRGFFEKMFASNYVRNFAFELRLFTREQDDTKRDALAKDPAFRKELDEDFVTLLAVVTEQLALHAHTIFNTTPKSAQAHTSL